jgi:hypothetical protein
MESFNPTLIPASPTGPTMKIPRATALLVGCLVLLQGADFLLTWKLLASPDVYESNPVALAILRQHGWSGLCLFKLGCTAVIVAAALLLRRRRPSAGAWLLVGCCCVMVAVAGYSLTLLPDAHQSQQEWAEIKKENDQITSRLETVKRFLVARRAICRKLLGCRVSLSEAIGEMCLCIEEHRAGLSECLLARLPATDQPRRLAAYLLFNAEQIVKDYPSLAAGLPALRRQAARYLGGRDTEAPLVIVREGGIVTALVTDPAR